MNLTPTIFLKAGNKTDIELENPCFFKDIGDGMLVAYLTADAVMCAVLHLR